MKYAELPLPVQITLLLDQVGTHYHIPPHDLLHGYTLSSLLTLAQLSRFHDTCEQLMQGEDQSSALRALVAKRDQLLQALTQNYLQPYLQGESNECDP